MTRVFPADYWTAAPLEAAPLSELCARAFTPISWRERIGSRWSSPEIRLLSVIRALRTAFSAETAGLLARADFYLEAAHHNFERLIADRTAFETLSARCGGLDVLAAAARELFLETHAGWIRGYLKMDSTPQPGDRVLRHAALAERALIHASLPQADAEEIRAWLRTLAIKALQHAGRYDDALVACESVLRPASPDAFKDLYVQAVRDQATREPVGPLLERLRRLFDCLFDRPLAWACLADLSKQQVAALAGDESPGVLIATIQRALDADPFNLAAQQVDVQSRFALQGAQQQLAQVEATIAAEGKVLNEKGLELKRSILGGFVEAQSYLRSEEASAIQDAAAVRWSSDLWVTLGLPLAGTRNARRDLIDAIGAALVRSGLDQRAFSAVLVKELTARPSLQDLDAEAIAKRLPTLTGRSAPAASPTDVTMPAMIQTATPMPVVETASPRGSEDFADWWFSAAGRPTRWSMAVASLLLTTAGVLTVYNRSAESARRELYPQVMAAVRQHDDQRVADLSAEFISNRPLRGRGPLDQAVEQVYAEALIRLFATSADTPSSTVLHAAERFHQLIGQTKEERP